MQQTPNPLNQNERPEKKTPQQEKTRTSRRFKLEWILILLLLIVLGGILWNHKQTTLLKAGFDTENQQVTAMKAEWDLMKNQLQTQYEQLQKTENPPSVEYKIIQTQQPQDLIYLIQFAQQSLKLQKNVSLALQSLRLAMGQVNASKDEGVQSLKGEIEKQIHKLQAIELNDDDELIERLSHLAKEVNELSIVQAFSQKEETEKKAPSTLELTPWERIKQTFIQLLKKAVVVRNEPVADSNTFVPSQTYLAGQLQLWLLKAQWAVFQHQGKVYQKSLDSALNLLKRYFVQDEKNQAMASQLERLKTISIDPELPDLSELVERLAATGKSTGTPVEKKPEPVPDQNKEMPAVQEQRVLSS